MSRLTIRAAVAVLFLTSLTTSLVAFPPEVAVESANARLLLDLSDGRTMLKSIVNKATGEKITFDPSSDDFVLTTDKGELTRSDFKVVDVITHGNKTYVVTDGQDLAVTHCYEVWDSGCIKRSLQLFAKSPMFIEKVSLVNSKLNEAPAQSLQHNARFLQYGEGGFFLTVEMPMPSRQIRHTKDGMLLTAYEPVIQMASGDTTETVPAVVNAWAGDIRDGYECYRDYTYELSRWRKYATVRTSSASPTALTTAYDGYKAVDDDPTTRWRTENALDGTHWLEIEFPRPVKFNRMTMLLDNEEFRPALDKPTPIGEYHLQVWRDDSWHDVAAGAKPPTEPMHFADTRAGKVRLLIEGCYGRFSLWDFRLYQDFGAEYVIPDNVCSRFWVDQGVRMPFTYFNTWYISHTGIGRLERARGLLTYDTVLPQIPLAAQCGMENFVLDSGWKYAWHGIGLSPKWPIEFPDGIQPFVDAADRAGINLAAWFHFFWLQGDKYDHQWRVVRDNGSLAHHMCLLSGYYDFVKNELLHHIRNSHMKVMKIDGFVPADECHATNHNHKPGRVRDAEWLAYMRLVEELKRQYPGFRITPYTWDGFWVKYSELIHTYQDHGGLTPGELAPTRAKMNYMHDREMFNEAYWRYLVRNNVEGSAIIQRKTPEWREELIGNLAQTTRRQISTNLLEFTADERNWIRSCIDWSRKNARYLEHFKPFFPNPDVTEPWGPPRTRGLETGLGIDVLQSNTLEGYAHISDNQGYVFIFNPTFYGARYSIAVSEDLGFTADAANLTFQVIYPYAEAIQTGAQPTFSYGDTAQGYLPAEKHIVVRISKQPIPLLFSGCRYTAAETIWDSVDLSARAVPTTTGGVIKTKLVPPERTAFDALIVNGKPVERSSDGAYEITLQVPVRGALAVRPQAPAVKDGRKTVVSAVSVSGDLLDPSLMLFLYRTVEDPNKRRPKAQPGELDFRLLVDRKPLQGVLGDTLEKDWETEKDAGWWIFELPADQREFTVTVECAENVRPVLLYSAIQDAKEAVIVAHYARQPNNALLTSADPEVFFHRAFPEEREYFPVIDLVKE